MDSAISGSGIWARCGATVSYTSATKDLDIKGSLKTAILMATVHNIARDRCLSEKKKSTNNMLKYIHSTG